MRKRSGTVVLLVAAAACGGGGDDAPASSVTARLAPSQTGVSTVPPPEVDARCVSGEIDVVAGVGPVGGDGEPQQIIDLVNTSDQRCEVDLSASSSAGPDMEPNAVLAPGGVAHLWVRDEGDCDASLADPQMDFTLDVNGEPRRVELTFGAPCGVELWAFFTD